MANDVARIRARAGTASRVSVASLFGIASLAVSCVIPLSASPQHTTATTARPARRAPACASFPACPWPAEAPALAVDLTSIEGPGTNDFHQDLSGAFWNPFEPALWVCRNGGAGGSKVWKLVPNGADSFQVGTVAGQRAEWTGFGDCEALALGTFAEPSTVFTVEESSSSIREWDLSSPTPALQVTWNVSAFVPTYANGLGIEALTFVLDADLAAGGFVGADGQPRTSALGMGALAFVGHQNGGRVYVFDLDRSNGGFQFVGEYATGDPEIAELTFDPTLGVLYAWHGDGRNDLEALALSSHASGPSGPSKSLRALDHIVTYDYPGTANDEGFALQWSPGGCTGVRGAFVLVDGGGAHSLLWFRQFPCGL